MKPQKILDFWFKCTFEQHFGKNAKFDAKIRQQFLKTHEAIARGETADWRKTPRGRLAEIIVLDQFSRNMFRGRPEAFAYDTSALILAQEAVRAGADKKISKNQRLFMYLPFMHSESKKVQRDALKMFTRLGDKKALWFERDHKKIIDRFGRYPHRNRALGRTSTRAELAFMKKHKGY
jgi:uncharacterized protein (DUF924 family)